MATEVRYWKKLERHPLSAEYSDLKPAERERMRENLKQYGIILGRKVILASENGRGKPKVLDGWQLLQACIDENIKPQLQMLPKSITPEAFVEIVNDCRRHEDMPTMYARAAARRKRVVEARQEGQSIRAIAESEKVSPSTISEDLRVSAVQGEQVTPPTGKVTGKDNKPYPSKKTRTPVCSGCLRKQRTGQPIPAKCIDCKNIMKAAGKQREPGSDDKPDRSKPKQGEVLFDFKEFEADFGRLLRQVDKLGKAYKCKESKDADLLRKKLVDWMHDFKEWAKEARKEHAASNK